VTGTKITYVSPSDEELRKAIWPQDFLSYPGPMLKVEALPGAKVLASFCRKIPKPLMANVLVGFRPPQTT
jgi:hypothetical protein